MNKNVMLTALLVAVSSQSVSAVPFFAPKVNTSMISNAFATVSSFVKNHKVASAIVGVGAVLALYSGYKKRLTISLQRLVVDVKRAVDSQKSFIAPEELKACKLGDNPYGQLDFRNYPCVSKATMNAANIYIVRKNALLKPGIARQEILQAKIRINEALAIFKNRLDYELPVYGHMTLEEIEAGFKEISDSLKLQYETIA